MATLEDLIRQKQELEKGEQEKNSKTVCDILLQISMMAIINL